MILVTGSPIHVDHDDAVWLSQALWMTQGPGRDAAIGLARRIGEALVAADDAPVTTDADEVAEVRAILARGGQAHHAPTGLSRMAAAIAAAQSD